MLEAQGVLETMEAMALMVEMVAKEEPAVQEELGELLVLRWVEDLQDHLVQMDLQV